MKFWDLGSQHRIISICLYFFIATLWQIYIIYWTLLLVAMNFIVIWKLSNISIFNYSVHCMYEWYWSGFNIWGRIQLDYLRESVRMGSSKRHLESLNISISLSTCILVPLGKLAVFLLKYPNQTIKINNITFKTLYDRPQVTIIQ